MKKTVESVIAEYLPSKNVFWRRFFPLWFLFNWKYFYVLFESAETLYPHTRLEYVTLLREQNLMALKGFENGICDYWMFFWNIGLSLVFPFVLVYVYYWFIHPEMIKPIYKKYKKEENDTKQILSNEFIEEGKLSETHKSWIGLYEKEIKEKKIEHEFLKIFHKIHFNGETEHNKFFDEEDYVYIVILETMGYIKFDRQTMKITLTQKGIYLGSINSKEDPYTYV